MTEKDVYSPESQEIFRNNLKEKYPFAFDTITILESNGLRVRGYFADDIYLDVGLPKEGEEISEFTTAFSLTGYLNTGKPFRWVFAPCLHAEKFPEDQYKEILHRAFSFT